MKYPRPLMSLLFVILVYSGGGMARNVRVIIPGGEIHMRGQLTNGACVISADSQDLHVDMGQYTTHAFKRVGDLSAPVIPFTIRLTDCGPGLEGGIGITFSGVTAPKEPDVFLVAGPSDDTRPTGISGRGGYSGLGLLITDPAGHQVIPGGEPDVFSHPYGSDISLHYLARYRATSRSTWPGELRSEVRVDIAYP
ncbi:type 1 fimbrial protein subunit FimI [Pantoea agglomerans]|uniref:Type 1 fimbrial protein subunit FimI n=1 Tax=Enterobacter agglomerans TaxID=549 RepID=A0ACC5PVG6_ENTAG|nr:fimbrial protein [Pantoea agglomerans]MBD8129251.1 type 1 fimbrial protein subunit FimI [Pantoea agglomerans]MBD8156416.1 type 1 fimbrial protein subunit FimI [Pantoea agglomerans]MBD8161183.1 type 1 fimbrial protein subunit FimI [Pantoea agglomerans]MBD8234856.1 type 1 fimbrial protein subunit FimI [Pantoea agglomerans]MBD8245269.1 type 1 fimbrial protein subunit FimI [Pantoea agglomerans]